MTTTKAKISTKTGNPFLDGDFTGAMDFTKFAEQFRLPGVDSKALMESQRKNLEAVTKANQVVLEGVQAVMHRQAELLRQALDESSKAVSDLSKPGKPADLWVAQTDLLKDAYAQSLANLRELAEIGAKSNNEAAELLNSRFTASLDEFKGAFKSANGGAPAQK